MIALPRIIGTILVTLVGLTAAASGLLDDFSFEQPQEANQFGQVFRQWAGWKYEGDCAFVASPLAHTGSNACLLAGYATPKIRIAPPDRTLAPGRYRVTAWLRGLDIGTGTWNQTTEFMFDSVYLPLAKNGTFGWTPLTYVAEIQQRKEVAGPAFGLLAPGFLWVDDVVLERVADDTPLTAKPVLGPETGAIEPPGPLGAHPVRCAFCGCRNAVGWRECYACGTPLAAPVTRAAGPGVKVIASFEDTNPFAAEAATVVPDHATDGTRALRLDRGFAVLEGPQDWSGYDLFKADFHTDAATPVPLALEVRDTGTRDYWTRVNFNTVIPPGDSTLVVPLKQLYVGEKSRPGRPLDLSGIVRFVVVLGEDTPQAPLFIDHLRLERDDRPAQALFEGLHAFDFGTGTSPVMDGFTAVTPSTLHSVGRGYGLRNARIWRAFDALQPEPLNQDFLCIESGGFAVDVPNGSYRVVVNLNSPSGYWGEYQTYTGRTVAAEGRTVLSETRDFAAHARRYFQFWNTEDLPGDNTFDKYQAKPFGGEAFTVDVADGRLDLEFEGLNWACCVSSVIVYPTGRASEGERFLRFVEAQRRFYFDNAFKRVLHRPAADAVPTDPDPSRACRIFARDIMEDVYYNDAPREGETCTEVTGAAFAGEIEPLNVILFPSRDLGDVTASLSDLKGPQGTIPASAVAVGYVSYRLARVTMDGAVYTIMPRLIMPTNTVSCPAGIARRFWFTVHTPSDVPAGLYRGTLTLRPAQGQVATVPVSFRVRAGRLDPVDIPVGPWGHDIRVPWVDDDPAVAAFNRALTSQSLHRLREHGFTLFSGAPAIRYAGFTDGRPVLDFTTADAQMKRARDLGFLAVVSYGSGVSGFNPYYPDDAAMQAAGFTDYTAFVRQVYAAVQAHAQAQAWIPVYYNLSDEPIGEDLTRAAENAEAYRRAFPQGPPFFTGASSYAGNDPADPHFRLAKALHVANWNLHSEESVKLLRSAGSGWAFYNGGDRWTYGDYLYKAVTQFGLTFRIAWHWNIVAGDPYYALDCREDDYAWCNATPDGRLVPSIEFERIREGLDDYRRLVTLARLTNERAGMPAARAAEALIAERLASFHLGDRRHDALFGIADWARFRTRTDDAIEALYP